MFMLQSINNTPFFTLPNNPGEFNDPHDFLENFKSMANQSSGNRDGYGIIAYQFDNFLVSRDFSWYKTGMGNYLDENNLDEPFYEAVSVLTDNSDINRVLFHARSGTGGNGNHPFIFNTLDRTFTFMHNGYIFNTVQSELVNFLGETWFTEHPSQWEGEFTSPNTFIDSEVLFHYFMYYILKYPEDIPTAFRYAFNNKRVGNIDMEYTLKFNDSPILNFIFSDGSSTYAYRSSKVAGERYNLSYQVYPNNFAAIKTGSNLSTTITKNQLLEFTPQGDIITLSTEPILQTTFIKKFVQPLETNQYKLKWIIQPNSQITKFNIYRGVNQNFANAQMIDSVLPPSPSSSNYEYLDNYDSFTEHYYWIEILYSNKTYEITSNIPSSTVDDGPEIPEVECNINLFPNPFLEKLNIDIQSDDNFYIKIFNLRGQLVDKLTHAGNNQKTLTWDTVDNSDRDLPNGIYILKFISEKQTTTRKIMRIK